MERLKAELEGGLDGSTCASTRSRDLEAQLSDSLVEIDRLVSQCSSLQQALSGKEAQLSESRRTMEVCSVQ